MTPLPLFYPAPLTQGTLIRRYKRFLADVLVDGQELTVHCANTGAMRGLISPDAPVLLSYNPSPSRTYPYGLEAIQVQGTWVGTNTAMPNTLVALGLENGFFPEFQAYTSWKREVPYDDGKSRIDFLLTGDGLAPYYLEVKNVHDRVGTTAFFPDCPTVRGTKHMGALSRQIAQGYRAAVLYLVQRDDTEDFDLDAATDPLYSQAAQDAFQAGVVPLVYQARLSETSITLQRPLPFRSRSREDT